jgi:hypothetical protein
VELADTAVSKTDAYEACGFESHRRHHFDLCHCAWESLPVPDQFESDAKRKGVSSVCHSSFAVTTAMH